jgi:hypothetical protein
VFSIPNGERYNWDFLSWVTFAVDKGHFPMSIELALEGGMDNKPTHEESFH